VNGVIVLIGCVVGFLVYRRAFTGASVQSQNSGSPDAQQGDLLGGTTAALATILILAFLFGLGDGEADQLPAEPSYLPATSSGPAPGSDSKAPQQATVGIPSPQ
jgi:hypothetical protein